MDITLQRRCLSAIAGVLAVGTVAAIGWSVRPLDPTNPRADSGSDTPIQVAPASDTESAPFDAALASQSLRGPLYDPPPPPVAPIKQPRPKPTPPPAGPPKLDLKLVGTIIQTNQSVAILSDSSGQFDVKGIGESLELTPQGVTLQEIEPEQVTLQYQGRRSTLQLDKSMKKSGGKANPRGNNRRRNR